MRTGTETLPGGKFVPIWLRGFSAVLFASSLVAQANIDDFFRDFTADWVRADPNQATSTRLLKGEEQERLEQQLTPETLAFRRARVQRARRGLSELAKFDRAKLTD